MYPLEFKGGTPPFSEEWTLAVDPKEINGPVVLTFDGVGGSKCVSGFSLVDFEGEPESVEQVHIAAWVGDKLTLKNVQGNYLECIDGTWVARSKAVSSSGMLQVEEGWSFFNGGKILRVGDASKFNVLVRYTPVQVEPLTIADFEKQAGRPLSDHEVVVLFQAADRGELHEQLASIRDKSGKRV